MREGFTLIELVIVISIVLILSVSATVSFNQAQQKSKRDIGRLQLKNAIRQIQNNAITGITTDDGVLPEFYSIYFSNEGYYILFYDVNGDMVYDVNDYMVKKYDIEAPIEIEPNFFVLGSKVDTGEFCSYDIETQYMQCEDDITINILNTRTNNQSGIKINFLTGSIDEI